MKKQLLRLTAVILTVSLVLVTAGCKPMNIDPLAVTGQTEAPEITETEAQITEAPETQKPTEAEEKESPEEKPEEQAGEESEKNPEKNPEPSKEPEKKETEPKAESKPAEVPDSFYVKVNCETNTVNIFSQDQQGEYTVPYRVMVCSSGLEETPTPTGTYRLTGNRWMWLELVGDVWGMYTTQITGNYLFHSVPYTEYGNHGSLQEGEFDKLGEDASQGCIRLQVDDAKWIYDNMERIRGVEIYNSPDPGPMGKPTPIKIGERAYPGWDPTDQVEGNPWHSAH